MKNYSLTHLSDESLRRELSAAAATENEASANLLAHIAEFDFRKLYLPAAFPSMLAYCMGELRLSEDAAKKRIRVARMGRGCPAIFAALGDGRVHLSGLVLLATHLAPGNADELLTAATHRSMEDIEQLLAERFPKLDVPASAEPVGAEEGAARPPDMAVPGAESGSPGTVNLHARVSPLSVEAYAVQFTRSREADERFRRAQDLLGHQVPSPPLPRPQPARRRAHLRRRLHAAKAPRGQGSAGQGEGRTGPNQRGEGSRVVPSAT